MYSSFPLAVYFTHGHVSMSATLSVHASLPLLHCVPKSVLYVCVSIAALHMGSSEPSF